MRVTEASEIAFPPFVHWERFSARTISAFGAYTVHRPLLGVPQRLSTSPLSLSLINANRELLELYILHVKLLHAYNLRTKQIVHSISMLPQ